VVILLGILINYYGGGGMLGFMLFRPTLTIFREERPAYCITRMDVSDFSKTPPCVCKTIRRHSQKAVILWFVFVS
jgi:hypothetical protein